MTNHINWCEYFKDISQDPAAMTPPITVRQFLQARQHYASCDTCHQNVQRVIDDTGPESGIQVSRN